MPSSEPERYSASVNSPKSPTAPAHVQTPHGRALGPLAATGAAIRIGPGPFQSQRDTPNRTKLNAVFGFIVAHPGERLSSATTPNVQPARTAAPMTTANAAATKENLLKARSTDAGSRFLIPRSIIFRH